MAVGIYGTKKLADITAEDADILFAFSPTREQIGEATFKPLYNSIAESDLLKMIGAVLTFIPVVMVLEKG